MIDLEHSGLARALPQLEPCARAALERAAFHALRLHAEELGAEHLLIALMDDSACAAHRALVHAFADPATIAAEALALSNGILVVGSGVSLPFSELGVRALFAARDLARATAATAVGPAQLLVASQRELSPELRALLASAGYDEAQLVPPGAVDTSDSSSIAASGGVFRHYANETRRALGLACRLAHRMERDAIAPAHLLLACLEQDAALQARSGLSLVRARALLSGRDEDLTPIAIRPIQADTELLRLLDGLRGPASTLSLLARYPEQASPELQALLKRHRVSAEMIKSAQGAFQDP